jgi:hypothetical protein
MMSGDWKAKIWCQLWCQSVFDSLCFGALLEFGLRVSCSPYPKSPLISRAPASASDGDDVGMTVVDLLELHSRGWLAELAKLALMSMLLGWFQGARTWSEAFRDPVPFPPDYPPAKNPVPSPPDYTLVK